MQLWRHLLPAAVKCFIFTMVWSEAHSATNLDIEGNQVSGESFHLECSTNTINKLNYATFYRSTSSGQLGTLVGYIEFYPSLTPACREKTGIVTNYTVSCNNDGSLLSLTIPDTNTIENRTYWRCQTNTDNNALANNVISILIEPSTTVPPTTPPKTNDDDLYWLFLLVLILCVVLVVVIFIVSRKKTLVIGTLYVKETKNTVKVSLKPEFVPVPNTAYAKCAQNGLTENAEFIDGLFVVVFRELTPEKQHDVTMYCQNPADMKLYKSETCVVFTLKDSSNTNPKESNTVLALHLLDVTVSQTKVELSWTSPIAFDSTKVEYWVGSDKHITMFADTTSPATSTAKMTRLLPGRMITFTITGEKDGTKYSSGILHQKTLKVMTGCCP